jgi:hypothetical protein
VIPLATWLLGDGVNPLTVLRKTLYVTPDVADAVHVRLIDELETATELRLDGAAGTGGGDAPLSDTCAPAGTVSEAPSEKLTVTLLPVGLNATWVITPVLGFLKTA